MNLREEHPQTVSEYYAMRRERIERERKEGIFYGILAAFALIGYPIFMVVTIGYACEFFMKYF